MSAESARPRAPGALRELFALDAVDVALRLTLLDLLLRPVGTGVVRPLVLAVAAAGLLLPGRLRSTGLWLALAALTGLRVALDWPLGDNHAWLLFYWCSSVAIGLAAGEARAILATNARLLIGLAFAFATLWKVALSPDFRDGTFFRVTLVADRRMEAAARVATGLSADELAELRARFERHVDPAPRGGPQLAPLPPRLARAADLATVWTVAIEAAIALAFLWPQGRAAAALRDPLLILFCVTTYAVAPVQGFGWLLLAMGAAQAPPRPALRVAYAGAFGLVLLYSALG
jgi:hypothetical protein